MSRSFIFIRQSAELIYLALQSFVYFSLLQFFSIRLGLEFLSSWSIIWVILVIWVLFLSASFLTQQIKIAGLVIVVIVSFVSGVYIFGAFLPIFLLMIGLFSFAIRRAVAFEPISEEKYSSFFGHSLLFYGLIILFCFFARYSIEELHRIFLFLILNLLLTILGLSFIQLYSYHESKNRREFWKQWGIMNGVKWGGLGLLSIGSLLLLFIGSLLFKLIKPIFDWGFPPLFNFIFNFLNKIVNLIIALFNHKRRVSDDSLLIKSNSENINMDHAHEGYLLIDSIIKFFVTIIIIGIVLLLFYLFVRAAKKLKNRSQHLSKTNNLVRESMSDEEAGEQSWWEKRKNFFQPHSNQENHPIRKNYRDVLSVMRKKGLWINNAMTIEQINEIFPYLEHSSMVYKKLRYGDQEVSEREIELFKKELQEAILRIKEINK